MLILHWAYRSTKDTYFDKNGDYVEFDMDGNAYKPTSPMHVKSEIDKMKGKPIWK